MTVTIENDRTGKKTEFYYVPHKVADGIKALLYEAEKNDSAVVSADLESDEYYEEIMQEHTEKTGTDPKTNVGMSFSEKKKLVDAYEKPKKRLFSDIANFER